LGQARHLGLAASYLPQDARLCSEAAASLAGSALELLAQSHFRDGIQLMQRAVDLGFDEPAGLLRLAEAQVDVGLGGSALDTMQRVDTRGDAELDAQLLQARGNAIRDSDAEASAAMLADAATRWATLGNQRKHAWALANRGMSLFELGRLDEAATEHETALQIFTRLDDQAGVAAAGQALALERPDDPRVPAWLDAGLELAEETGDLAQQRNSLISLAWTRFIRSGLGGDQATAQALGHAEQLAAVSAELGDAYFEMQGHCMAAVIHRLSGREDAALEELRGAQRAASTGRRLQDPLLLAVEFMVRTARGDDVAAPAPVNALNPLAMLADSLVTEALLLAGDVDAAIGHLTGSTLDVAPDLALFISRLLGVVRGAVLVLSGRYDEAEASLEAALDAAHSVGAYPTEVTATALLAEAALCRHQPEVARQLIASAVDDPGGIAGVLLDRVRWLSGDAEAERRLRAAAKAFATPGLTAHPDAVLAG
jgi:tetratricopeptide (TPR) repeat protein